MYLEGVEETARRIADEIILNYYDFLVSEH